MTLPALPPAPDQSDISSLQYYSIYSYIDGELVGYAWASNQIGGGDHYPHMIFNPIILYDQYPDQHILTIETNQGPSTESVSQFVTLAIELPDGFSVGPVPEPSTWTMLLIGFVGIGFVGYRKRHQYTLTGVGLSGDRA